MRGDDGLLDPAPIGTMLGTMHLRHFEPPFLNDRAAVLWQRAVGFATRLAIAFGAATITAILLGSAVTDNALAQIVVTVFAAIGLWPPFAVLIIGGERFLKRRRAPRAETGVARIERSQAAEESWRRLLRRAPAEAERIQVLRRSLDRSRLQLGKAELDLDAHELCVLIDRRLPELIDRELDNLAPDDRNRKRELRELIELIEQFARHCSRNPSAEPDVPRYDAAVLRRRFEERLSEL